MRRLSLVGVTRNAKVIALAQMCAWCRKWRSRADYIAAHKHNAEVTHGLCESCAAKMAADPSYRGVGQPEGPGFAA
jgi:hypothetical protein